VLIADEEAFLFSSAATLHLPSATGRGAISEERGGRRDGKEEADYDGGSFVARCFSVHTFLAKR
jgi:hypothetical protein